MTQHMTWNEIKTVYPDEWVALVEYQYGQPSEGGGVNGVVVAHHPQRHPFHAMVKTLLPQYGGMALRYTGQRIQNPEIPLLWQILHTNSKAD